MTTEEFEKTADDMFAVNVPFHVFADFVFSREAIALYKQEGSSDGVLHKPLYVKHRDMWLALAKQQEYKRETSHDSKAQEWQVPPVLAQEESQDW